jgi:dTDP-4-dehydrorhamnose reductase
MQRILLTGSNGQVGWELRRTLASLGTVVAADRSVMDLADPDAIRRVVRELKPQVIVNAAAYTAVDKAESDADLSMRINGVAPGILAEEARRLGALLVHYSTDYVFDGTKESAYSENDAPNPINAYGRTKLAGEEAIRAGGPTFLIFRTSWVYAPRGNNFLRTMLRLAAERPELKIVDDQVGAPTSANAIASMTAQVVEAVLRKDSAVKASGIYHFTASGAVSWFGFAQSIFAEATARDTAFKTPKLVAIPTEQYPLPARRPANSRLDCGKLKATFGVTAAPWEAMMRECLEEMGNG